MALVLLIGATEERQVVLVDVLGDVEAVGLDQLLVVRQLVLEKINKIFLHLRLGKKRKEREAKATIGPHVR